jgi:hypothetical protein
VGHFIGIVLRSGLAQELPFAPLVWKFLAGEKLRREDVFEVDDRFRESLKTVTDREALWSCDTWDGVAVTLPGHVPGAVVGPGEVDQYCQECVQFRLLTLKPALKSMRATFRLNMGFKRQPVMNGGLLSRMAQGFGIIAMHELQAITVYKDYSGPYDPYVQRFWRTVAKMRQEELKLLLKFITTLTRIPNQSLHPEFRLEIDRLVVKVPDEVLPTAATCYNRLHLPMYSNDETCDEKVFYAIRFCQTMENK